MAAVVDVRRASPQEAEIIAVRASLARSGDIQSGADHGVGQVASVSYDGVPKTDISHSTAHSRA
jgi:hypothetical protein